MAEIEADWPWLKAYPPGIDWHARFADEPVDHLLEDSGGASAIAPASISSARPIATPRWARWRAAPPRASPRSAWHGHACRADAAQLPLLRHRRYACSPSAASWSISTRFCAAEIRHLVEIAEVESCPLDLCEHYALLAPLLAAPACASSCSARWPASCPSRTSLLYPLVKRRDVARWPRDGARSDLRGSRRRRRRDAAGRGRARARPRGAAIYGGTTGVPKGAMLTHRNLVANVAPMPRWFPDMDPGRERARRCCRFFHVFAMTVRRSISASPPAPRSSCCRRFEMALAARRHPAQAATTMPGVPTLFKPSTPIPRRPRSISARSILHLRRRAVAARGRAAASTR